MTTQPPTVEILEWTPAWAERFAADEVELRAALPADATIEHIGSTSVRGLAAKPIVDIMVITDEVEKFRANLRPLEALGYVYNPKYFADDPDHVFLKRDAEGRRTEHLHIFHPRSPAPGQIERSGTIWRPILMPHGATAMRRSRLPEPIPTAAATTARPKSPYFGKSLKRRAPGLGSPTTVSQQHHNLVVGSRLKASPDRSKVK